MTVPKNKSVKVAEITDLLGIPGITEIFVTYGKGKKWHFALHLPAGYHTLLPTGSFDPVFSVSQSHPREARATLREAFVALGDRLKIIEPKTDVIYARIETKGPLGRLAADAGITLDKASVDILLRKALTMAIFAKRAEKKPVL